MNQPVVTKAADVRSASLQIGIPTAGRRYHQLTERVAVLIIIGVFCFQVVSLHPREFVGYFLDDTIYLGTAKALAAGQGYVVPSFPGVLPQTKYPILYPLILSLVWRVWPTFPNNLTLAIAVSIAIAAAYLVLSYVFIRRSGISRAMGLCALAAVALHPELQVFAGSLMSDHLFALFVVASALAADDAWLNSEHSLRWGIVAGFLLGLSTLTRTAGIGVITGIALYGAWQRRWKTLWAMLVVCAGVVIAGAAVTHLLSPVPVAAGSGMPPTLFQQVATYNSSYARFWLLSVPSLSVLPAMLATNLRLLILAPGRYLVMTGVILPANVFTFCLSLLATAASVGGIARWFHSTRRLSLLFAALGSLPMLLLWNYVMFERFLLPFIPLIFLGIAMESRRLGRMLLTTLRQGDVGQRALGSVISILFAGLIGIAAYNYIQFVRGIKLYAHVLAGLNRERREAYDWLSQHAAPSDRVFAYADGLTYLYTDRQSVRPVEITTDCRYKPDRTGCTVGFEDLVPAIRYAGAKYWIITPSDFELESPEIGSGLRRRISDTLLNRFQATFISSGGNVVVYDTACLLNPNESSCPDNSR